MLLRDLRASPAALSWASANTNATSDGNSLVFGYQSTATAFDLQHQTSALSTINNGLLIGNVSVSGQTTRQMNGLDGGSTTDIDGAWVNGKNNVMIVWEGTNSIYNAGRTGAEAAQDMADFIAARLAARPGWRIVLITVLPRIQAASIPNGWTNAQANAEIDALNTIMRQKYRAWGAQQLCDVRYPGSPMNIATYDYATADAVRINGATPWGASDTANWHIHLNNNGFGWVASLLNTTLARLLA